MGGAQAAKVMEIITLGKLSRAGQTPDLAQVQTMAKLMTAQLDKEAHVLFGTARLWDDGVIDPRDTRRVLGLCLSVCADGQKRAPRTNTFGVARM
jgi:geranyl-CoA carboxylase beta subunit